MCGIVGILGKQAVAGQVVEALRRLEYRGYDSAGVATLEGGRLSRRRAEGKLKNLEVRLSNEPLEGLIGIGHTRWATHGKPTESNAHPHATEKLAVVHNGIIENFRELKAELEADGHVFASETDTEVVAHLVTASSTAASRPGCGGRGRAARICAAPSRSPSCSPDRTTCMIGARKGSPLAVGHRRRRDVSRLGCAMALAPFTNLIAYLDEGDWVVLNRKGADLLRCNGTQVHRAIQRVAAGAFLVDKGNHHHFMAKEIHEQPEVVGHTLTHYVDMATGVTRLPFETPFDWKNLSRLSISACGTAYLRRPDRQILVRALCAPAGRDRCRLRIPLSRGAAAR
jgi:glucosamine--fructose-6-phosphate aminotransferase (isomerizing)